MSDGQLPKMRSRCHERRKIHSLPPYTRLIVTTLLTVATGFALSDRIIAGHFSAKELILWEEHSFVGNTKYQLIWLDGREAVHAKSSATASGLFRNIRIDLKKTPWLYWRWRVDSIGSDANERSRAGDDYPARIYVVKKGNLFPWRTRSVNYVWSSNQPVGSSWNSAFTSLSKMVAVQSGGAKTGQWLEQRRNVREDFRQLFGEEVDVIDVVAIMTDSDNTGAIFSAYYEQIFFSSE